MNEAITLVDFTYYSEDEKKDYILNKLNLSNFWLAGRIRKPYQDGKFIYIEELINPFTGIIIPNDTFKDYDMPLKIYCRVKTKQKIEKDTLVVAKVSIFIESEGILNGNIFQCNFNDIHVISEQNDVFDIIGMNKEDLGIYGLVKSQINEEPELLLVEIATDVIKPQIEQEIKYLEEKEAKLLKLEKIVKVEKAVIKKDISELNIQQKLLNKDRSKLDLEKKKLELLKEKLAYLGFKIDENSDINEKSQEKLFLESPSSFDNLIKGIQNQLHARGYEYELDTLRQLLLSLMTEQMIILSGPSGTGKTNIIKQLATIINADYEIIPVQPSWMDKQDLLGFYNPIRKVYVPTPFLDCLIKANQNKDRLYFICLDEINLSQIEYYLADILSIRELEDGHLSLYSDFEYKQNMDEIKWFLNKMSTYEINDIDKEILNLNINSIDHYEMVNRNENLKRYLPSISIPSNVRIIGTMNVDGNVQSLGPKVIDRSFIIPFNRQRKEQMIDKLEKGFYNLSADYFKLDTSEIVAIPPEIREKVVRIQNELLEWNLNYNMRFDRHFDLYYTALEKSHIDNSTLEDDIALLKILPRIHDMVEEKQINKLIKVFNEQLNKNSASEQKLEDMKLKHKHTKIFSYWS